jgi:hypothetical protein
MYILKTKKPNVSGIVPLEKGPVAQRVTEKSQICQFSALNLKCAKLNQYEIPPSSFTP